MSESSLMRRRPKTRRARAAARPTLAATALALLLACVPAAAQTLRWSTAGDPQTMDPHSQNEILTNSMNGQVYESLVTRGRKLELVGALATGWKQLSPTRWRLELRPGVKFQDGTPFTADDVVFSMERARQPSSAIRVYASALGAVERVDDLTVEFDTREFDPIFLEHLTTIPIMSRKWCAEHGVERPLDFKSREDKYTALHANGTGPYMLVSRQPDTRTVYKRNPNWWGKFEGNVTDVVYTPIKADATRIAALVSGEIDLVLDPPPQDVARLKNQANVHVIEGPENRVLFIGMDEGRDQLLYSSVKGRNPFRDLRVRRAMYQAVDIEAIHTRLMRGQSFPTGAITPSPRGVYGDPQLEARALPYDPAAARRLMAEAGYPDGFEVTLDCTNDRYVNDEQICQALASMWGRIGVKVRVNAMPRAQFFPKMEKLDTSMYMLGWGGSITDAETTITPILRKRGAGGVGDYNWGQIDDPEMEKLAVASSREPDLARREELVKATIRREKDQAHHVVLHRQVIPWAARSNVEPVHRADNWLEWQWVKVK